MKKIAILPLLFLAFSANAKSSQLPGKDSLSATEKALIDTICNCMTKRDLSKITSMAQIQPEVTPCFMAPQSMTLIMQYAIENNIDLSDEKAGRLMGEFVGKKLFAYCPSLLQLAIKISENAPKTDDKKKH
jgi:hypothetical protein